MIHERVCREIACLRVYTHRQAIAAEALMNHVG